MVVVNPIYEGLKEGAMIGVAAGAIGLGLSKLKIMNSSYAGMEGFAKMVVVVSASTAIKDWLQSKKYIPQEY